MNQIIRISNGALFVAVALLQATAALAQAVSAPGYLYAPLLLGDLTQSCVAVGAGGTFVAIGPGFSGNAQQVVFAGESGGQRTVAGGFNSIGGCAYDAAVDTLYVTDNALEAAGAITGDTVYAIPAASTAVGLSAAGLELLPPGAIASASSVALDRAGVVHVGNAVGGGSGSVLRVEGGVATELVSGLDFVGGLVFEPSGDLLVAQLRASFDNEIRRYGAGGGLLGVVSGPTLDHGSFDLARLSDGRYAVTGLFGGDVVALDPTTGGTAPLVSGLSFATGASVDAFTGRLALLSSTFVPTDEDRSVHRFVPVARLLAGKGSDKKECLHEFYGLRLVPTKPGKKARKAICRDGDACDADGRVNRECLFPVGFCMGVADDRLPACRATDVTTLELKKVKPFSSQVEAAALAAQEMLPSAGACAFSDGLRVALRVTRKGKTRPGKASVKVRVTTGEARPRKDTDKAKLVCEEAL